MSCFPQIIWWAGACTFGAGGRNEGGIGCIYLRMRQLLRGTLFLGLLLGCGSWRAWAQTDLAISGYGAFNQSTTGKTTIQKPFDQGGFLIEARHISNPIVGYEVTYAFNRANQAYATNSAGQACPAFGCSSTSSASVQANAHEVTADWVASLKILNFRPFALAGGGVVVTSPQGASLTQVTCNVLTSLCSSTTGSTPTQTQAKAMFVYGAGLDWTVVPHLGLRFQYRGRVYKAPDLVNAFSSTDKFTRTSEPVLGVFLRF
jgi:opacity protein-like surface antigen